MADNKHEGTTYGNARMYRALIAMLRHSDVRWWYAFMAVCVVPVTLLISPGARLTRRYYRIKKGHGWWRSLCETYLNHVVFGQTVIDKFAMYAGHSFRMTYHGEEAYRALASRKEALVQLSAHIGCSEIIGYSYDNLKRANVLAYGGENASLMAERAKAFGNKAIRMIPVGTGEANSGDIIRALDDGEIVCAFADRFADPGKTIRVKLHGHNVRLAKGPFKLATTRALDVVMANAMKERDGSYTAFLTPLAYDKTAPKREQIRQLAEAYIKEVERLMELYPLQWFNYSDIWEE